MHPFEVEKAYARRGMMLARTERSETMTKSPQPQRHIPALRVAQWLPEWNRLKFDGHQFQARPKPYFYLVSLNAAHLKALTGVYRRSARPGSPRAKDPNVQRGHEEGRSRIIRNFVQYGFPWCEMSDANRKTNGADSLRKPGWLPSAIVVNVLSVGCARGGNILAAHDAITIVDKDGSRELVLPSSFTGSDWQPSSIYPLEVIDGQHRLWAFEDFDPGESFELPVVAFDNLDRSWQAYLFWSVNITPKRINRSLAFDLYPLLRREEWLQRFAGHSIYRETRCQELVEALWSHPESPWKGRINMLGETSDKLGTSASMVTQAAWIRSLMASFVKEWRDLDERSASVGGLFGASRAQDELMLPWNRAMQSAFLIHAWDLIHAAVHESKANWAENLRSLDATKAKGDDPAFFGKYSLLSTDQGVRGVLQLLNDMCYVTGKSLELAEWNWDLIYTEKDAKDLAATDEGAVTLARRSLRKTKVSAFLEQIAAAIASYDWRTSSTPGLTDEERRKQAIFRGSSGYKELRQELLHHVCTVKSFASDARKVLQLIG